MSPPSRSPSPATGRDTESGPFPVAFAGYVGTVLASATAVLAARTDATVSLLVAATVAAVAVGALAGVATARSVRPLPVWLGATRRRRLLVYLPAAAFAATAGGAWFGLGSTIDLVALVATFAVGLTGYTVAVLARNRYVDTVTAEDPLDTWRWDPPGSATFSAVLLVLWIGMGAINAAAGDWHGAVAWTGLGLSWTLSTVVGGQWRLPGADPAEIRVHETGLVKRRPYARSLIPWDEVDHVRLRDDELVLERGFFEVRFDRDELEDPVGALETIERTGSVVALR